MGFKQYLNNNNNNNYNRNNNTQKKKYTNSLIDSMDDDFQAIMGESYESYSQRLAEQLNQYTKQNMSVEQARQVAKQADTVTGNDFLDAIYKWTMPALYYSAKYAMDINKPKEKIEQETLAFNRLNQENLNPVFDSDYKRLINENIGSNMSYGLEGMVEGIGSAGQALASPVERSLQDIAKATGNKDFEDWTNRLSESTDRLSLDYKKKQENRNVKLSELQSTDSDVLNFMGKVANQVGGQLPTIGLGIATGGGSLGLATMGVSAGGNKYAEALDENASNREIATLKGIISGATEYATEKIFDGNYLTRGTKKSSISDAVTRGISHINNNALRRIVSIGADVAGENAEELISNAVERLTDMAIDGKEFGSPEELENEIKETISTTSAVTLLLSALGLGGGTYTDATNIRNTRAKISDIVDNSNLSTEQKQSLKKNFDDRNIETVGDFEKYVQQLEQTGMDIDTSRNITNNLVTFNDSAIQNNMNLNDQDLRQAQQVAENRGVQLLVDASQFNDNNQNALYDYNNETGERLAYINPNADPVNTYTELVAHELYHDLVTGNNANKVTNVIVNELKKDSTYNDELDRIYDKYKDTYGKEKSDNIYQEELVAEYIQKHIADEKFINNLIKSTDKGTVSKIIDTIKSTFNNLSNSLGTTDKTQQFVNKVQRAYEKGYNQEFISPKENVTRNNEQYSIGRYEDRKIQGLEDYDVEDIKLGLKNDIANILQENGLDNVNIVDLDLHGSRLRGTANNNSDLDVVVQYDGDIREDDLFNLLNEKPIEINGVKIDINPIQENLQDYMKRSNEYDNEILAKNQNSEYNNEYSNLKKLTPSRENSNIDIINNTYLDYNNNEKIIPDDIKDYLDADTRKTKYLKYTDNPAFYSLDLGEMDKDFSTISKDATDYYAMGEDEGFTIIGDKVYNYDILNKNGVVKIKELQKEDIENGRKDNRNIRKETNSTESNTGDYDVDKENKVRGKNEKILPMANTTRKSITNNNSNAIKKDENFVKKNPEVGSFNLPETDNKGNVLSSQQQEYFKDSKARDKNGKLEVLYHSTPYKFNVFNKNKLGDNTSWDNTAFGFFVTSEKKFSERFRDINNENKKGYTKELYANIKNPIIHPMNAHYKYPVEQLDNILETYMKAINNDEGLEYIKEVAEEDEVSLYEEYMHMMVAEDAFEYASDERETLEKKGYDAVEFVEGRKNILVDGSKSEEPVSSYAVFKSNQLKNIDNKEPTKNPDIRYSVGDNNYGKNWIKYKKEYETNGADNVDVDALDIALKSAPANKNNTRTIPVWRKVAHNFGEQLAINETETNGMKALENLERNAYISYMDLQPLKSLSRYNSETKGKVPFIKYNYKNWVEDVKEGYFAQSGKNFANETETETKLPTQKPQTLEEYYESLENEQGIPTESTTIENEPVSVQEQQVTLPTQKNKFNGYTQKEIENIESNKISIAKNNAEIDSFVENSLREPNSGKKLFLSKVMSNIANKVKQQLGLNVDNYNISIRADDIQKIFKSHGKIETETPRGQIPITKEDIKNIPKIINEADNISRGFDTYQEKPSITFEKNIDGNNVVVTYLSDKHHNLELQTMWKFKNNKNFDIKNNPVTGVDEQSSPTTTSETNSDTDITNNIPQSEQKINLPTQEDIKLPEGKTRQRYKTIIGSDYVSDEAKQIAKKLMGKDTYEPDSNAKQLQRADDLIEQRGIDNALATLETIAFDNSSAIKPEDIAIGDRLIQYYGKIGDKQNLERAIRAQAGLGTKSGQNLQAFSMLRHQTPTGMAVWIENNVNKLNDKIKDGKTKFNFTPEMKERIVNSTDQNFESNVEQVLTELGQQVPKTTLEKMEAWRYFAMLSSPRTHVRNIIGNKLMGKMQQAKSKVAGTIENIARVDEKTHTGIGQFISKENKEFAEKQYQSKDIKTRLGVETNKYTSDMISQIKEHQRNFKSNILENTIGKLMDFNSKALETEDTWGLKKAYIRNLADYMTANGLTEENITSAQLEKANKIAIDEALKATFHQANMVAQAITQFENKNTATKLVIGSLLPFKKTPANIAVTGAQYSPAGLIKSLTYDSIQLKKGNIGINQYIDNISKGLTGTGIAVLGYALAEAGLLSAGGDGDKKDKYDEDRGSQNYSITLFGNTYSLDWVAPSGIPLFVGAEISRLKNSESDGTKEGDNKVLDSIDNALNATLTSMNPMTEMSMISGLVSSLKSFSQGDTESIGAIAGNMAKSYVNQFVPTLVGQVAKSTDEYERSTTSTQTDVFAKTIDQTKNQIMSKIPGLRQLLPTKTDVWGEDVKSKNIIENAILPWNRQEIQVTNADKTIDELYDETGDTKVLPSTSQQKKITINGENYRLTNEEYAEFKKNYGQTSAKYIDSLANSSEYKNMTADQQVKAISTVYEYANALNKENYAKENGLTYESDILKQADNFIKSGGNMDDFFKYKGMADGLTKDSEQINALYKSSLSNSSKKAVYGSIINSKDSTFKALNNDKTLNANSYLDYKMQKFTSDKTDEGKTVENSRKNKLYDYLGTSNLSYNQRLFLAGSEYKLTRNELTALYNYVDSFNISSSEKLEIFKKLKGYTVYNNGSVGW